MRLGGTGVRSGSSGSMSRRVGIKIGVSISSSESSCLCFKIMKESEYDTALFIPDILYPKVF